MISANFLGNSFAAPTWSVLAASPWTLMLWRLCLAWKRQNHPFHRIFQHWNPCHYSPWDLQRNLKPWPECPIGLRARITEFWSCTQTTRMFSISAVCPSHFCITVDNKGEAFFTSTRILNLSLRTVAIGNADKLNFWPISQFYIPLSLRSSISAFISNVIGFLECSLVAPSLFF